MSTKTTAMPSTGWLALFLAIVVIAWGLSGLLLHGDEDRGTFGDMFGAVNALFSGLAFAALIFTVWMQRVELSLQRQELELTREELRGQKEEMKLQNQTFALQRFENTFFALLTVHAQIVEAIDLKGGSGSVTKGRDCFKVFYSRFTNEFDPKWIQDQRELTLELCRDTYAKFHGRYQHELGHYFRHLYHIIKFVKESDVAEKRRYTNFVRAQLSSYELAMLFYNGVSDLGVEKFKPLIEEFALLKNLPEKLLVQPSAHSTFYRASAYSKTEAPSDPE
jgi:hypothetical protein